MAETRLHRRLRMSQNTSSLAVQRSIRWVLPWPTSMISVRTPTTPGIMGQSRISSRICVNKSSKPLRLTDVAIPRAQPDARSCEKGHSGHIILGPVPPRIVRIGLSVPCRTSYSVFPSCRLRKTCAVDIYWYSGILWTGWIRGALLSALPCTRCIASNFLIPFYLDLYAYSAGFRMCGVFLVSRYLTSRQSKSRHCAVLLGKQTERIIRTSLNLYQDRLE